MATAKVTRTANVLAIPIKVEHEISLFASRMETVECTAICVEFALLHQDAERDREIAWCMHRCIVDEIGRLREQFETIRRALLGTPHTAAN